MERSLIQGKIVIGSLDLSAVLIELQPSSCMFVLSSEDIEKK